MASSSSSSSGSENRWNHDVFLSFRGPDTRNTLTGHLYNALDSKGIKAFIDNELQRGEVITSELLRVIEESRISVVLLSENYASSSFCLDELEKILESRESKGQTVIPVFYHVDPTDVEEQRGTFGQEFAKLEAQLNSHLNYWKLFPSRVASFLRYVLANVCLMWPTVDDLDEQRNNDVEATENMDKVQKWRLALTKIAGLSGWHLKKGDHEADIIQDIVKKITKKLNYTPLHVAEHPIGLASRVEYILQDLNIESHDVYKIGLHGMGGVGKTTTAAALYNTCASQFEFEGSCFLSKVSGGFKKDDGIAKLQRTLLYEILGDEVHITEYSLKGIGLIKWRLRNKKVLIVFDDVDHIEQLQELVGGLEWFGGGSIIIITTRDLHLLEYHQVRMIHEIEGLANDEALQLFSWYAFKEPQPDEAYTEFSSRVIRYAKGLPLALRVLGSTLYGRSILEWKDVLKKLKQCPNNDIIAILRISYDGLDSEEKAIFLNIAYLFYGMFESEVIRFLDELGFSADIGVRRLIEKSLVYFDDYGELEMHDLLKEMAMQIDQTSHVCIRTPNDILVEIPKDKSWRKMVENVLDERKEDYPRKRAYESVIPGTEIPEWFGYDFDWEDKSFTLSASLSNQNLIAFAFCVVFQAYSSRVWDSATLEILISKRDASFNRHSDQEWKYSYGVENMWLGFYTGFDLSDFLEDDEEISCKVDCTNSEIVLKRVGVHLIYENEDDDHIK